MIRLAVLKKRINATLREAAKGGKGPAIKEKIFIFRDKKAPMAIKLEGVEGVRALMTWPLMNELFCGFPNAKKMKIYFTK